MMFLFTPHTTLRLDFVSGVSFLKPDAYPMPKKNGAGTGAPPLRGGVNLEKKMA